LSSYVQRTKVGLEALRTKFHIGSDALGLKATRKGDMSIPPRFYVTLLPKGPRITVMYVPIFIYVQHPPNPLTLEGKRPIDMIATDGNVLYHSFLKTTTHRHDEGIAGQHTGHKGYYPFNYVEMALYVLYVLVGRACSYWKLLICRQGSLSIPITYL